MIENLLTTRQVQELFKVDRITVYRMLKDGRLNGIKIGNQWRFPRREVEKLLDGTYLEPTGSQPTDSIFPTHCVQTIQDLFTAISETSAVVIDVEGNPITRVSQPGAVYQLLQTNAAGRQTCSRAWKSIAIQAQEESAILPTYSNLHCIAAGIFHQDQKQGVFLAGEFFTSSMMSAKSARELKALGFSPEEIKSTLEKVPHVTEKQMKKLIKQPAAASRAIESILIERGAFIDRLQRIANLTK
jgi:excisionase family DNA binding protein